jgi:hypothetical protein
VKINICGSEYIPTRSTLKQWLVLQDKQVELYKAMEHRNDVAKHVVSYVSIALSIPEEDLTDLPWYDVGLVYLTIRNTNTTKFDFPFFNTRVKDKKEVWDYEGRTFYIWAHLFAEEYGWDLEYIANLDVDDAIALAQEIAVEEQLNKEWEWMRSEIAYQSKDGFKELPRPDWMRYTRKPPEIPKLKIRKEFMPSGIIYRYQAPEPSGSLETV